jgi:hypothetical protein
MKVTCLIIALIMLLSFSAMGQPNQYSYNMMGQTNPYSYDTVGQMGQYSAGTSNGAPTPGNPTTPESLGMQTPSVMTSQQAPTAQEESQGLIMSSQQLAYAAAPQGLKATATSPTYAQMIVPTGTYAPNSLYVFYAPQTTAGCYLYANLPLWMNTGSSGNIWFYEWYPPPQRNLITNYAGYVYSPGWYKRWFYADVPGWHILQYYCNGWSNYAYIYVYGYGSGGYYPTPTPSPQPYPYPYYGQTKIITTYSGHTDHGHKNTDH